MRLSLPDGGFRGGQGLHCGVFDAVAGAFEGNEVGVVNAIRSITAEAMVASPKACPQH